MRLVLVCLVFDGDLYPGLCLLCGFKRGDAREAGNMAVSEDSKQSSTRFNTSEVQTGLDWGWSQLYLCLPSCLDMRLLKSVEQNPVEVCR